MADGVAVSSSRRDRTSDDAHAQLAGPSSTAPSPGAVARHAAGSGSRRSPSASKSVRSLPSATKRSFRLPEVVLGVLLVAGCALGAVLWQRSADSTTTVVVASRPIARGSIIGPDDLRGAQVGGETSAMISGESAHALLGKVALVDIAANVPMSLSLLSDSQPLGVDEALTSMALKPGDYPPDLAADDTVRILVTGRPDATGSAVTTLVDEGALVWAVDESADGAATIVTIRGSLSLATAIAAANEINLVRVEAD